MNKELPKHILGLDKYDLSHELRKQFKQDHPETIGEKETAFDDMNYIDWLEKQYQILSESQPQGIDFGESVKRVQDESESALWQPCSGCHETVEGQETGHYSYNEVFKCYVGSGCHECGGIGVVWNDYSGYGAQPQGMRWVKASERLPVGGRYVFLKCCRVDRGTLILESKEGQSAKFVTLYNGLNKVSQWCEGHPDLNAIEWLDESGAAPQGTVEETTDADIVAIEHLYDVFSNWYHDDGNFDTFLRSEALKAIKAYAATKSASSTPNPAVQGLIEKWETEVKKWKGWVITDSDQAEYNTLQRCLTDLKSLQSQTNNF